MNIRTPVFLRKAIVYWIALFCLWITLSAWQGLSYRHLSTNVPQSIHVLEVDPTYYHIEPAHAYNLALGRETVQAIVKQHGAIAGVNGGFFKGGEWDGLPAGILKINHQWFSLPNKTRGAIGWSEGGQRVLIDQLSCPVYLKLGLDTWLIDGLNRQRSENEIILFSPSFGSYTKPFSKGFEIIIRHNQVQAILKGGKHMIPQDGWVLSVGSQHELSHCLDIAIGTSAILDFKPISQSGYTSSIEWDSFSNILGGTPVLVRNGHPISDFSIEKTYQTFLTNRYARTAVGILPNGHWLFVVVDGHQPRRSKGMTMKELAELMTDLGCVEALNLDGGGSSTMVIQNNIVNEPHGDEDEDQGLKKVRRVSDAILILEKS